MEISSIYLYATLYKIKKKRRNIKTYLLGILIMNFEGFRTLLSADY